MFSACVCVCVCVDIKQTCHIRIAVTVQQRRSKINNDQWMDELAVLFVHSHVWRNFQLLFKHLFFIVGKIVQGKTEVFSFVIIYTERQHIYLHTIWENRAKLYVNRRWFQPKSSFSQICPWFWRHTITQQLNTASKYINNPSNRHSSNHSEPGIRTKVKQSNLNMWQERERMNEWINFILWG